ncbi:BamA/TamA family outer membrane protein [Actibacterium pelagium]|uniref:Bacterial surface antigen (D15) domain-containing protein n=1 Tax=Actibacterium pelagium TaxID=2029103 RepID=A0A917ABX4_9RHOB|nr:BamA/TamA family outer membrane protein [Actibacterium pelagium]GGE38878.1 hypothetical protein GCM10011517_03300 [Actibacterium pelagium]
MTKTRALAAILLMTAPGLGQAQAVGELSTGLSYSTKYGATAFVSLDVEDILSKGIDVGLTYRAGEEGFGANLRASKVWGLDTTSLGNNAQVKLSVKGSGSDWDFQSYDETSWGAALGLSVDLTDSLSYSTELFWTETELDGFGDDVSDFITIDEGKSHAAGIGASLRWSTRDTDDILAPGNSAYASVRLSGLGGARKFSQVAVGTNNMLPLFGKSVLNVMAETGVIEGRDGEHVSVIDRAFLGGTSPRGFSYGGLGPRDVDTGEALGGTRYVFGTLEVLTPLPRRDLSIGVFTDFGSVWDLPGATASVSSNDYHLRSSAGISLNWDAGFGRLRASVAEPMNTRDGDETQTFSLSLNAVF